MAVDVGTISLFFFLLALGLPGSLSVAARNHNLTDASIAELNAAESSVDWKPIIEAPSEVVGVPGDVVKSIVVVREIDIAGRVGWKHVMEAPSEGVGVPGEVVKSIVVAGG